MVHFAGEGKQAPSGSYRVCVGGGWEFEGSHWGTSQVRVDGGLMAGYLLDGERGGEINAALDAESPRLIVEFRHFDGQQLRHIFLFCFAAGFFLFLL